MCKLFGSKDPKPEEIVLVPDGKDVIRTMLNYALEFVGTPYRWGGDDPIDGFDCSGYAQEVLASVSMDPPGDQTAQALHNHFLMDGGVSLKECQAGAFLFYGKSVTQITHVSIGLNHFQIIEAGGGGSTTTSREAAAQQNAYIRVRGCDRRPDLVAIVLPDYSKALRAKIT